MSELERVNKLLTKHGLSSFEEELIKGALPSIRINKVAFSPDNVSRLGGAPLVPGTIEWPHNSQGQPLNFICQIDFAEIKQAQIRLPNRGLLCVFCSIEDPPYETENFDKWRIFFFENTSGLKELKSPNNSEWAIKPYSLKFAPESSFPEIHDERFKQLFPKLNDAFDSEMLDKYFEFHRECCGEPNHKIGGYPQFHQGDARREYRRRSSRENFADQPPENLNDVQLLLQIGPDDDADFEIYQWSFIHLLLDKLDFDNGLLDKSWLSIQSM